MWENLKTFLEMGTPTQNSGSAPSSLLLSHCSLVTPPISIFHQNHYSPDFPRFCKQSVSGYPAVSDNADNESETGGC